MIEPESGFLFRLQEILSNLRQGTLYLARLTAQKVRAKNLQVDKSILVDTISENTPAAGVTIDSLLIKDGAHGQITGTGDLHTEYGALAQAETWAALQTFNAGLQLAAAQQIKDSGGTGRILLATASPFVTITGDLRVQAPTGVFSRQAIGTTMKTGVILALQPGALTGLTLCNLIEAGSFGGIGCPGDGFELTGIKGQPQPAFEAATILHTVHGLRFTPTLGAGVSSIQVQELIGAYVGWGSISFGGTISEAAGLRIAAPFATGTPTYETAVGADIQNMGNARTTDAYGLRIANITGATGVRQLIEALGLTTANLRVEAGDPAANVSQILIAVNNGAVVLRRIEIGAAESGGAGYRMLRVLN